MFSRNATEISERSCGLIQEKSVILRQNFNSLTMKNIEVSIKDVLGFVSREQIDALRDEGSAA